MKPATTSTTHTTARRAFRVCRPVRHQLPQVARPSKYAAIWRAVARAPKGTWVPVKCQTAKVAQNIYASAYSRHLRIRQDGTTLYLTTKGRRSQ